MSCGVGRGRGGLLDVVEVEDSKCCSLDALCGTRAECGAGEIGEADVISRESIVTSLPRLEADHQLLLASLMGIIAGHSYGLAMSWRTDFENCYLLIPVVHLFYF